MRKMHNGKKTTLNIVEVIILNNHWEYFVTDEGKGDIKLCYVLGYENELGDASMSEIEPYIISRTKDLSEVMAAPGWNWQ